jgi:regulator of sigma E protease
VDIRQRGGHADFFIPNGPFIVGEIDNDGAAQAGLKVNDRIIAINDVATPDYASARPIIKECADTTTHINITVERAKSENITLDVPLTENGIGIKVASEIKKRHTDYTFWGSIPAGVKRAGKEISGYWEQMTMMVKPETQLYQDMGGFIAIGSIFPDAWNMYAFWNVTALLSIILAVMNLLPIPVLDGGHVLFTLWEIITRRKPNERVLIVLQNIGFWLLMALILYANGSDILRLFK